MKNSWKDYYEKKDGHPPSQLMLEGLRHVEEKEAALDIGAGGLVDSQYLVDMGFEIVVSIDSDVASAERATEIESENFSFIQTTFEEYQYPENYFDYINAQFSLQFIHHDNFQEIFTKIKSSLKKDGVLVGQLFGNHDAWNTPDTQKTLLTRQEVDALYVDMEIIELKEVEYDKPTVADTEKHWHQFNFIVRKKIPKCYTYILFVEI